MCMAVLPACVTLYPVYAGEVSMCDSIPSMQVKPKEGIKFSRIGVTNSC